MTQQTQAVIDALKILRDPSHFQWPIIPILVLVMYAYATEIEHKNWNRVHAGLALFLTDLLWEILNALILRFTGVSSLWVVSGGTSFLIFVGLSIEICLMFALAGLMSTKLLPKDRRARILGLPNRWFYIGVLSCLGATVESLLVKTPHFHWGYAWWNFPLVALIGYAPFEWIAFKVYDSAAATRLRIVGGLAALDALLIAVFGLGLGWI